MPKVALVPVCETATPGQTMRAGRPVTQDRRGAREPAHVDALSGPENTGIRDGRPKRMVTLQPITKVLLSY